MNLTLQRDDRTMDGIFGTLRGAGDRVIAVTLEHSFDLTTKLAPGTYKCRRGWHRLHPMSPEFQTFEILGVPDFQGKPVKGILFHKGNFNHDSEGCVLLGTSLAPNMISGSLAAFEAFMALQEGVDEFVLYVADELAP